MTLLYIILFILFAPYIIALVWVLFLSLVHLGCVILVLVMPTPAEDPEQIRLAAELRRILKERDSE